MADFKPPETRLETLWAVLRGPWQIAAGLVSAAALILGIVREIRGDKPTPTWVWAVIAALVALVSIAAVVEGAYRTIRKTRAYYLEELRKAKEREKDLTPDLNRRDLAPQAPEPQRRDRIDLLLDQLTRERIPFANHLDHAHQLDEFASEVQFGVTLEQLQEKFARKLHRELDEETSAEAKRMLLNWVLYRLVRKEEKPPFVTYSLTGDGEAFVQRRRSGWEFEGGPSRRLAHRGELNS